MMCEWTKDMDINVEGLTGVGKRRANWKWRWTIDADTINELHICSQAHPSRSSSFPLGCLRALLSRMPSTPCLHTGPGPHVTYPFIAAPQRLFTCLLLARLGDLGEWRRPTTCIGDSFGLNAFPPGCLSEPAQKNL